MPARTLWSHVTAVTSQLAVVEFAAFFAFAGFASTSSLRFAAFCLTVKSTTSNHAYPVHTLTTTDFISVSEGLPATERTRVSAYFHTNLRGTSLKTSDLLFTSDLLPCTLIAL